MRCGNSYVVSELLDTEQSYIQDLGHVVKVWETQFAVEAVEITCTSRHVL